VSPTYITTKLSGVHEVDADGVIRFVDPLERGWVTPAVGKDRAEMRRSVDAVRVLSGFGAEEPTPQRLVPGKPDERGPCVSRPSQPRSLPAKAIDRFTTRGTRGAREV
jgi:hypothetical protein